VNQYSECGYFATIKIKVYRTSVNILFQWQTTSVQSQQHYFVDIKQVFSTEFVFITDKLLKEVG